MFQNKKKSRTLKKSTRETFVYKNVDLMEFDGPDDDYRGFGSSVVKKILTPEERAKVCFSPRRKFKNTRMRARDEDEKAFKGIILNIYNI